MKTIIYNRVSSDEQNPENQIKDCEGINHFGFETITFQEKYSAWKDDDKRQEFQKIILLVKNGSCKHLIVWDLDRIYRNRLRLKEFFKFAKAYNCQIHSVRQKWLEEINNIPVPWNEIVSDMLINIFGWIGEEESGKKSDRVKAAIRKEGNITMSYRGNKWGRRKLPEKVKLKVIELHKAGLSYRKISREVHYTDKNNKPQYISVGTVHKILSKIDITKQVENERV